MIALSHVTLFYVMGFQCKKQLISYMKEQPMSVLSYKKKIDLGYNTNRFAAWLHYAMLLCYMLWCFTAKKRNTKTEQHVKQRSGLALGYFNWEWNYSAAYHRFLSKQTKSTTFHLLYGWMDFFYQSTSDPLRNIYISCFFASYCIFEAY